MKRSINLMTEADQRSKLFREARLLWSRIIVITTLGLVCLGSYEWWQGRRTTAELEILQERYTPMEKLSDDCVRMRTSINAVREAQQLVLKLVDSRPVLSLIGAVSNAAADSSGGVFVHDLVLRPPSNSPDTRIAVLQGKGLDYTAIARFAADLRARNLFDDIVLSSSASNRTENDKATDFRIEFEL